MDDIKPSRQAGPLVLRRPFWTGETMLRRGDEVPEGVKAPSDAYTREALKAEDTAKKKSRQKR